MSSLAGKTALDAARDFPCTRLPAIATSAARSAPSCVAATDVTGSSRSCRQGALGVVAMPRPDAALSEGMRPCAARHRKAKASTMCTHALTLFMPSRNREARLARIVVNKTDGLFTQEYYTTSTNGDVVFQTRVSVAPARGFTDHCAGRIEGFPGAASAGVHSRCTILVNLQQGTERVARMGEVRKVALEQSSILELASA